MRALAVAAVLALAGCVSVSEDLGSVGDVGADEVMVVGKIEILPAIKPEEQSFKALDPFNTKRHHIGRAIMFMSDKPEYREHTDTALNPPLEQTYFLKLSKAKPYMVKGSVTMSFALRVVSRRQSVAEQTDLLFPAPMRLDIRPGDRAIYVGTLRLHRDEFHEVTKAEVRDDYASAIIDFRRKFGAAGAPRKALLAPVKTAR